MADNAVGTPRFFCGEIDGLKAEESLRRVQEIRVAHATSGKQGDGARAVEREWGELARRADRELPQEKPKMTKAEYDTMLGIAGVYRREWVINDG